MQTLERISAQRKTMEDLGSIVRTMKTLSAVMVKQVEARRSDLEQFERTNWLALSALLKKLPILQATEVSVSKQQAWIVIGSERGFCGRFNEQIMASIQSASQNKSPVRHLTTLGTRFSEKVLEHGISADLSAPLPATPEGLENLLSQLMLQVDAWQHEGTAQVRILHNKRRAAGGLEVSNETVWPIPIEQLQAAQSLAWPTRQQPLVLADPAAAFQVTLRQFLKTSLLKACMESMLCESSARLSRLQVAEDNISQRLEDLKQIHNTLRQGEITSELQDITAAFDLTTSQLA
jgi:F-type H+-transporting ATPase subunit gamma